MNNDQELKFAKTLEEVRNLAKNMGNCIASEKVRELFAHQNLSEEQFSLIYDYLKKHKIGIDEAVNPEDYMTEEEKNYLADYLFQLKELKQYTKGEKEAALLSAMAGDREGQNNLMELYLPKVVDIAKLYTEQGVFLEDLIGEGNLALTAGVTMLGCVETSGEAEGILIKIIMDAMEGLIADTANDQRTDQKIEDKVNAVAEAAGDWAEALGRKVTVEELAAESQISEKMIREAVRLSGNAIEGLEIKK